MGETPKKKASVTVRKKVSSMENKSDLKERKTPVRSKKVSVGRPKKKLEVDVELKESEEKKEVNVEEEKVKKSSKAKKSEDVKIQDKLPVEEFSSSDMEESMEENE